jgi:hypothetical protein
MFLSQLVEINEKGSIASSVNFGMMDNPEMNLHLCEGFIFNYDPKKPELSTVGILDLLRRSYHSQNEPNIHLMIQDYGKGKSHFAVVIANFFKKPFDSSEVQGILHQVEVATTNKNRGIGEGLKLYKQNQHHRHLVICLSGDKGGDIKKQFIQVLIKSLEEHGITDTLVQNTCSEPLRYLESLNEQDKAKAEEYLQNISYSDGDLNCIISLLRQNNYSVISTVKELAYNITGFTPDFSANIDIEAILQDLLRNYCIGENAIFQGILIIFDELNYYLQSWSADQIGAGGTALQNITNICENFKGKIALLNFAQFHPSKPLGISANSIQTYQKIATRLAPKNSTYDNPASSLELVLDNLLIQKENSLHWGDFHSRWFESLARESRIAYEQRIKIYREKGWTQEEFYRYLGKGCFPLHPLTAYLLCNLDFTQDRTAIQFIKGYVKKFIQDEQVEKLGQLNYIYPIALVDTFIENFSNESVYSSYKKSVSLVAGSDETDELILIKSLFLFYACGERLTKSDREDHQEILAALSGLPKSRLKMALDKLEKTRDIIYYRPEIKLYRFWEGISPANIEEDIEEKIKDKSTSVNDVVIYCQSKIHHYFGDETIVATQFVKVNKLVSTDWQFEYKVYSIDGLIQALNSDQTLRITKQRGILAYVLAETQEDLQQFRRTIDNHLSKSTIKNHIVVAIPNDETGDLAYVMLKIKSLRELESSQKRLFGTAYEQLLQRWEDQVKCQLERLFKYCTYHCIGLDKIPASEQGKPQRLISILLQELYCFVPPVDEIDKMRSNHTTGSKIISFTSRQLFADSLTPQTLPPDQAYKTVIDTIFVTRWGLLKKTSQKYLIQEPTNEKIRAAWDKISQITDLQTLSEKIIDLGNIWKTLSLPPYGYNEYNFTILLAAWLAYHRKEVSLKGAIKLNVKKGELAIIQEKSLKDWAIADNDILQKPTTFVSDWISKSTTKLIRRKKAEMPTLPAMEINYDQAQHYLTVVTAFLESNEPESGDVEEIIRNREQISPRVDEISNWFQPVIEFELMSNEAPLEVLLQLYPRLIQRSPVVNLIPNVISVHPTQQQRDRQTQALQTISNKITAIIETVSSSPESSSTEEACNAYKAEIQAIINQISTVTDLPPHLIEILRNAIRTVDSRLTNIKEYSQVKNYLSEIQNVGNNLNDDSTQQDYIDIRSQIETLTRGIPDSLPENIEVQQILQNLDQRYKELSQQIDIWQERCSGVTSQNQILELFEEINKKDRLFTQQSSKQKITSLQEQLKQELLKIQSRDDTENLVRSELSNAQQKLQRIRDLSLSKLNEAFQVYRELRNSSLSFTEKVLSIQDYQQKLNDLKVQGRTIICEKFERIYKKQPNNLEECDSLKDQLERSQKVLNEAEDFAEVKASIEQAIKHLEAHSQNLQQELEERQKQAEDNQIMQEIRKYNFGVKFYTLSTCEAAIDAVENFRQRLNKPEQYTVEIEQILQSIYDKINVYRQSLSAISNQLATVNNLGDLSRISAEYAKLELIFQDSDDHQTYENIQKQIHFLNNDLVQIQNLEIRCQQSNNIFSCQEVLKIINELIENQPLILHNLERFRERIINLEEVVRKKIQNYTSELRELEYNLQYLTTVIEAERLRDELLKKSSQYLNSDVEEQYNAIRSEVKLLIQLLQIVESLKINTLEDCQVQLDRIRQWQYTTTKLTDNLRDRVESLYTELKQRKAQIIEQKKLDAQQWLKELSNQCAEIYNFIDDTEKLEAANNILQQIKIEKRQYIQVLNSLEQQSLEYIERQCIEEQGKHKANQILLVFRQLPRLQRQSLYDKLAQFLSDETED